MKGSKLIGQRFGSLVVIDRSDQVDDGYIVWQCRCDCGNSISVNTKRLKRGTITNCGCRPKENSRRGPVPEPLKGRTFGDLTVLYQVENKNRRTNWMCRCECGKEKAVAARDLKSGKVKSCGCRKSRHKKTGSDLTGQQFGRLTVLSPTNRKDKKYSPYWHCRCECGQTIDVPESRLIQSITQSCGCLKREKQREVFKTLHLMDGTCVEWLEKRKHRRDNTSGFRGVYLMKNGKYRVGIGFKGQRFHLGCYDNYEEAVNARLKMERLLHDDFICAYYEWQECARGNPEWKKKNPLIYEAEKRDGEIIITKSVI